MLHCHSLLLPCLLLEATGQRNPQTHSNEASLPRAQSRVERDGWWMWMGKQHGQNAEKDSPCRGYERSKGTGGEEALGE